MTKKLGSMIKEARTNAGYTQQELANQIPGLSASDISKAERAEKDLTQDQLKAIAKATGVTQKSLLEAAGYLKTSGSGKTGSTSSGKTGSTAKTGSTMKLTVAEKKLVEAYRKATADQKKAALKALKGESSELNDILSGLFENVVNQYMKKDLGGERTLEVEETIEVEVEEE